MTFLLQAARQIVFMLDSAVYGLIPAVYELIFYLSNINLANNDVVVALINRIYLLLGIFMLFKVSFSIMQYIVDPNAFSDKSKGFGKLVTNAMVAVVLLAMVPFIFEKAYELQNKIILSNVIPNLILGQKLDDYSSDSVDEESIKKQQDDIHSMAVDVQFTMFSAFYSLNTNEKGGYPSCAPSTTKSPTSNIVGSTDMIKTCWNDVKDGLEEEIHKQGGQLKGIFKYCKDESCSEGIQDDRNFASFAYLLWWAKDGGSDFTIVYFPIVSAAVGLYLLLLLVTFAIDIAARVFKLLFLQAVAPIAIVSYIDPKESASNGKLHNWASETLKTYVSLFLRLAVIYLAIQLIKLLTSVLFTPVNSDGQSIYYNGVTPEGTMSMFVYVFLILGIFIFAKKVPQMIESIFGMKMSGEMHLSPFKAIGENAGATALIGGAAGLVAGGAAAAMERKNLGGGLFRTAASGIGGAISGAAGGAVGGFTSGGKNYIGAGLKQGGRVAWNMNDRHSTTLGSRLMAGFQGVTGAPMGSHQDKQKIDTYKSTIDGVKKIKENAKSWATSADGLKTTTGASYVSAQQKLAATESAWKDSLKTASNNTDPTKEAELQANAARLETAYKSAKAEFDQSEKALYASYVNDGYMQAEDKAIINQINYTNKENKAYDGYDGQDKHTWEEINELNKQVQAANTELSRSNVSQDHARAEESDKRQAQRGLRSKL